MSPNSNGDNNANMILPSSTSAAPTSKHAPQHPDVNSTSPNSPTQRAILFYHQKDPYYCFTNFSPHPVEYLNKVYPTSEHLFQAFKVFYLVIQCSLSSRGEYGCGFMRFSTIGLVLETRSRYRRGDTKVQDASRSIRGGPPLSVKYVSPHFTML